MPHNDKPTTEPLQWTPPPPPPRGCDCCDPTAASPDPVVVRLEAEVERLNGDYAKLYGVVREYIACEKHPQLRGEAYRDLRGTYDALSGADADQGWPACYQRILKQLDDANADNAHLRGLLREAVTRCDSTSSIRRYDGLRLGEDWFKRVILALEVTP